MQPQFFPAPAVRARISVILAVSFLAVNYASAVAQSQSPNIAYPPAAPPQYAKTPPAAPRTPRNNGPVIPTSQAPSKTGNHPADINPGRSPHSSDDGAAIAAGAIVATSLIADLINHYNNSPEKLGKDGPQVPKELNMNGFVVKGLAYPNWPVVLDFMLDTPGNVQVDITAADGHTYGVTLTNLPNRRAFGIFKLPADFGSHLQAAVYRVTVMAPPGSYSTPPLLRTYGMGAGYKAVGSVAIDQLTFQPAIIHPQARELANYGFHAHSAFDSVQAEFIFTTFYKGSIVVQKDQEQKLSPIPEGERGRGTWGGNGKPGEHMLEIRAWRGLQNGGDWVVAWSPDIVDVVR